MKERIIIYILTALLIFTSAVLMREVYVLQGKMLVLEDNYAHLLHRANAAEFWEVLPIKGE